MLVRVEVKGLLNRYFFSDVLSPSVGPPTRLSKANFAEPEPAQSMKTIKKGRLKARNRYQSPKDYFIM
jgi:hypothetical protein